MIITLMVSGKHGSGASLNQKSVNGNAPSLSELAHSFLATSGSTSVNSTSLKLGGTALKSSFVGHVSVARLDSVSALFSLMAWVSGCKCGEAQNDGLVEDHGVSCQCI